MRRHEARTEGNAVNRKIDLSTRREVVGSTRGNVRKTAVALAALATLSWSGAASAVNSITVTTIYDYDAQGRAIKEAVAGDDSNLCLVTAYTNDSFGHHKTMTQRNCNGSAPLLAGASTEAASPTGAAVFAPRVTTVSYTPDQRFIATTQVGSLPSDTRGYDARFGTQTSEVESNGVSTGSAYDNFGRPILTLKADGTGTSTSYALCSTPFYGGTATTCPGNALYAVTTTPVASVNLSAKTAGAKNGPYVRVYYDNLARELRTETEGFDGSGASTLVYVDTTYDAAGNVKTKSRPYYANAAASLVTYNYDAMRRPISRVENDAAGSVTISTSYSGATVTDYDGLNRKTVTVHDLSGLVASVTNDAGGTITRTYDANGDMVQSVDAMGNVTSQRFDARGRRYESDDPDLGKWTYGFDSAGDIVSQTDNKGQVSTFQFDAMGRLTFRSEPDLNSTWIYDSCAHGAGRLCEEKTTNGYDRVTSYDTSGRVYSITTSMPGGSFTASQNFDSNGRLSQLTYPSGLVLQYAYTPLGYGKSITDTHSNVVVWSELAQDASSRPTQYTYANGNTTTTDAYYDDGRLHTSYAGAGNATQNLLYTYDAAGNIQDRQDMATGVTSTYQYDDLNRLQSESRSGGGIAGTQVIGWTYDAIGNITTRTESGTTNTYDYNPSGTGSLLPHAVQNVNGSVNGYVDPQYRYDANGNMTSSAGRSVGWTSYNMASTVMRGAATLGYLYGPSHQRAQETYALGGATQRTTAYVAGIDGTTPFFEEDTGVAGTVMRNFVVSPTGVVAVIKNDTANNWSTQYWHKDHLGSISVVTDAAGNPVERLGYEPFGKRRNSNGTTDPNGTLVATTTDRGYTGQEEMDEVGLVNMNGRIYDGALGRFMSADPNVPYVNNLQSYNRYSYSRNNPLRATDPTGFDDVPVDSSLAGDGDSETGGDPYAYGGGDSTDSYGGLLIAPWELTASIPLDTFTPIVVSVAGVTATDSGLNTGTSVTGVALPAASNLTFNGAYSIYNHQVSAFLTSANAQANTSGTQDCVPAAVEGTILDFNHTDPGRQSVIDSLNKYQQAIWAGYPIAQMTNGALTSLDGPGVLQGRTGTDEGDAYTAVVTARLADSGIATSVWSNLDQNGKPSNAMVAAALQSQGEPAIISVRKDNELHAVQAQWMPPADGKDGYYLLSNMNGGGAARGGYTAVSQEAFVAGTWRVDVPGSSTSTTFSNKYTVTLQPAYPTIIMMPMAGH